MGKGDKRTLRGKIFKGSYGNKRPRKPVKNAADKPAAKTVTKVAAKTPAKAEE